MAFQGYLWMSFLTFDFPNNGTAIDKQKILKSRHRDACST